MTTRISTLKKYIQLPLAAALLAIGTSGCSAAPLHFDVASLLPAKPSFGATNGRLTSNFSLARSVRPEPVIHGYSRQGTPQAPQAPAPVYHRNNIPL